MSEDILKYCYRSIVRYLSGDIDLFRQYVNKAIELYEEEKKKERLYVAIEELLDLPAKEKLRNLKWS